MAPAAVDLPQEHKPVSHPLPPLPSANFMGEGAWSVLWAIIDGALPSITSDTKSTTSIGLSEEEFEKVLDQAERAITAQSSRDDLRTYLEARWTEQEEYREDMLRTVNAIPAKAPLVGILNLLNTRMGSLLFTGYWSPITQQSTLVRQQILKSWSTSRFVTLRTLAKSFTGIAQKVACFTAPVFKELSGYTDVPRNWKASDGYDFQFIQVPEGDVNDAHVIETDVVIVGSGPGGAVTAKNLSDQGHKVLVVDKGYYFPPSQLPMSQASGTHYLFDACGVYMTEDASASVIAGSTWGGGGTVNWSVSLRPQDFVRQEWADEGLPLFASKDFDDCIDRVCSFIGVGTDGLNHNHRNRVILDGCKKLGWKAGEAPQNTAGREHYCGQCHFGCGSAEKRGPTVAWLPAAAANGAEFMEGFKAERVVFAKDGVTAEGVEGVWTDRGEDGNVNAPESERKSRKVIIKAKKVVVSAGSLWSPVILMASGVENTQLGKNLHIHPAATLTGTFKENTSPWEGGIITSYSSEFENLDQKGHGAKLEPTCMIPYTALTMYPWTSGLNYKLLLLKYPRLGSFISLVRDRDTGSVFRDPKTGSPRLNYTISEFDAAHGLEGIIALTKLCYISGSEEIQPYFPNLTPWTGPNVTIEDGKDPEFVDLRFAAWLKQLRTLGNKPPVGMWSSAHQMGTCRMAANPDKGVVDGRGKVWGKEGLYVADASVFPSATGVNPMVTVMSIADWISRGLAEELTKEKGI